MQPKYIFFLFFVTLAVKSYGQNAYTGDVWLTTQAQLDSFFSPQNNYAAIDGDLVIGYRYGDFQTDIHDLSKLMTLKFVLGRLFIDSNPLLKTLHGLDSLQTIKSVVDISFNDSLTDVSALKQLQPNEKVVSFTIAENHQLASLSGLGAKYSKVYKVFLYSNPNLTDLGSLSMVSTYDYLDIIKCSKIKDLTFYSDTIGLVSIQNNNQLETIDFPNLNYFSRLEVFENPNLNSFSATNAAGNNFNTSILFEKNPKLKTIDGFNQVSTYYGVSINENDNLLTINNLFNNAQAIDELEINHNPRLKSFGPFTGSFPKTTKNIEITHNDSLTSVVGLRELTRVDGTWSTDGDINLRGNPLLTTLDGLDSLKYARYITFRFTNISTLAALHNLDSIGFTFTIPNEIGDLQTLEGLENLSYIQHGFVAHNKNLKDISALMVSPTYSGHTFIISGCDSLDPSLSISNINAPDFIDIYNNPSIKEITGFSDIDSLHRGLIISNNENLEKITCLKNLKYVKIGGDPSSIANTPNLTNISGLCPLFTEGTIDGTIEIHDNAPGFNSVQEIIDWCMTPTEDLPTYDAISVYPNPTSDAFQIEVPLDLIQVGMMVDLVDISGTSHFSVRLHDTVSRIPVGDLPPGLYFLRIVFDGRMVQVKKMVVER